MANKPANLHPAVSSVEVRDFAAKMVLKLLSDVEGVTADEIADAQVTVYHALLRLCNRIAWEAKDQVVIDFTADTRSS